MYLVLLLAVLASTLTLAQAGWCGSCDNAPSRSWSWWFGFGKCRCYSGWSGSCCSNWAVTDWNEKVRLWNSGDSCEAQPANSCKGSQRNSPADPSFTQAWDYPPDESKTSESQCTSAGCLWVECFESSNSQFNTPSAGEMCSNCAGAWQGKCEWHHYAPGALAFAGPGEHCGFKYPTCPSSAGKNCFCSAAAKDALKSGWCNNGQGMDTFCPAHMVHNDGRSQECSWNGWTVAPQENGGIDATCDAWSLIKNGDPGAVAPNKINSNMEGFSRAEPGVAVESTSIGAASALFLGAGAFMMRGRRRLKKAPGEGQENLEMPGAAQAV